MKTEFHPDALAEFQSAAEYYQQQQRDLGTRFTSAIESVVTQIGKSPHSFRVVEDDVRRCLAKVFPYAVLYSIEADYVLIVAVMHCHREPGYWRSRLLP